jgi:ribosome-associated toxin RatA of RatAB toxin-antitoxin module
MRTPLAFLLLVSFVSFVDAESVVDFARVTVEKRPGGHWSTLDSQVTGTVTSSLERVLAVIQDYESYPRLFPKVKQIRVERETDAVLLSEVVTVEALGIVNTNRFTLRLLSPETRDGAVRVAWSQASTDGTIDGLEGSWTLREVGSRDKPSVRVTYRTKSSVPQRVPGQDVVIGMFLGGETKAVVEAVFKEALSR